MNVVESSNFVYFSFARSRGLRQLLHGHSRASLSGDAGWSTIVARKDDYAIEKMKCKEPV